MTTVTNAELQSAPDDVIRATLIFLCDNDAELRARVTGVFRVASVAGQKKRKAGEQELPAARRQKLEELRMCIMCEMPYLESENIGNVCRHHPYEAEINREWVLEEYRCYRGDEEFEDTPQTRRDVPEAFWYSCCDKDLTANGCRRGRHYATIEERDNDPLREDKPPSEEDEDGA